MAALALPEHKPMGEMNTTPLIDVLLVLLVMIIITIPAATHSVAVDLPQCGDKCDPHLPRPNEVKNKLVITPADRLLWNGEAIDQAQLGELLAITADMEVEPELQFEPAASASYAMSASVLRQIKLSGVTKFGFVGNEKYRQFAAAP